MTRPSFRVYFVPHGEGFRTGIWCGAGRRPLTAPPPSAVGSSEEDAYRQLEMLLREGEAAGKDHPSRYLWEGEFEVRMVTVDVHPQTTIPRRSARSSARRRSRSSSTMPPPRWRRGATERCCPASTGGSCWRTWI